ncbi:MAG: MotA/TolQ/ExbB proton channel family protein [Planctomycetaceae bacterium]|nr:MotA/TolQ/ExbB proton channel family protein [Planctomycetaceae bacterium]
MFDALVRSRRLHTWLAFATVMAVAFAVLPAPVAPQQAMADENAVAPDGGEAAPAPENQGGGDEGKTTQEKRSFLKWMWEALGWFWMLVFSMLSFIMVALIMMNMLQVRRDVLLPNEFVEEFEQKLNAKDFQNAYEMARTDDSFVARVLAAGMGRLSRGYPEAMEGMQEAGEDENMALEHRLSYLALIGTVAPMFGLMGTVQGMIASFDKIASSAVAPKPSELAEGISTALFTTLIGLGIAIPAMVFYSILKNRVQRLVLEIGMVSESLMSRFATVGKK